MNQKQRRDEVEMMLGWLEKRGLIDYVVRQGSKYSIYLINGYKHIGGTVEIHPYLSGATDMMHLLEGRE